MFTLLTQPSCVRFSALPKIFDVAEIYRLLRESGQCKKSLVVDRTHLVLVSGKLVQQKKRVQLKLLKHLVQKSFFTKYNSQLFNLSSCSTSSPSRTTTTTWSSWRRTTTSARPSEFKINRLFSHTTGSTPTKSLNRLGNCIWYLLYLFSLGKYRLRI